MTARALAGVFCLALLVRGLVFLELHDSVLLDVLLGDSLGYVAWARELAAGNWRGDEVFYQAPLYPYFIGLVLSATDGSLVAVRVIQLLLGAGSCVLLALATARFFRGEADAERGADARGAGLAAGLLLAVYPMAIFFDAIIQKTSVATFLLAALLYLVSRFDRVQEIRWPLLAGCVLGALILTRENALIFLPVIGLWCLLPWLPGTLAERGTRLALFALGTAMILVPVGARNWSLGDEFLITTSQLGPNLYIGNNPRSDGRYKSLLPDRGDVRLERHDARRLAEHDLGRALSPAEVSDYWVAEVLRFMREEPAAWLRLNAHKAWMVINAEEIADTESFESYADESLVLFAGGTLLHFGVLFPLALLGAVLTRARWRELALLHAMILAMAFAVAAFFVMARYRFPLVPLLAMFAGAGLAVCVSRWRANGVQGLAEYRPAFAAAVIAALLANLPIGVKQEPRALTQFNVAMSMMQQDRLDVAQHYLERAAEVSVEPVVHMQLGRVLELRGEVDEAIAHYEHLLEARRADPEKLRARIARLRGAPVGERASDGSAEVGP